MMRSQIFRIVTLCGKSDDPRNLPKDRNERNTMTTTLITIAAIATLAYIAREIRNAINWFAGDY